MPAGETVHDMTATEGLVPADDSVGAERRQRDELLRLCIDAAPIGIAMFDTAMRYLAASRRFLEERRIGDREVIGLCHYDLFPDLPERWREAHRRCLEGAVERHEADPLPRPDGGVDWIRWEMRPWYGAEGQVGGVVLFSENVTDRVRADAERRGWMEVFEQAGIGIAIADARSERIQTANPAYAAMQGDRPRRMRGSPLDAAFPVEELARVREMVEIADRSGHVVYECLRRRADGTLFPAQVDLTSLRDGDGRIDRRIAFVSDISERRAAEAALARSESRYKMLLDSIHDGVFIAQDERFVFCNRTFARMLGSEEAQLSGAGFEAVIHPDHLERFTQRFRQRVAGARPQADYEIACRSQKDGSRIDMLLHATQIEHEGRPAVLGTVADISERRRIEDMLRQAMKMEAIGQLTGGIAHDFNNLLTVVIGSLDIALEQPEVDRRALLESALTGAQRGADLVRKLLAFARKQALDPRRLELNQVVQETDQLLRRALGEQVEIETRLSPDLWPVSADKSQIESALVNLAVNARDAMGTGGRLMIETRNAHLDEAYAALHAEVTPGDYAMLGVSDTGCGMSPEILERVLEPFFTTKEVGKGSGLGLSMVYGFVKQSKGHLKIYSEPGHGTTIRIYLPRAAQGLRAASAETAPAAEQPGGSETVLLVEDDRLVRQFVLTQVRSLGYRVLEAGDGPEALAILARGEKIDLLFTDVVLPGGLTGRALAEEVRRRSPSTLVLFTSGYTEDAVVHHGRLDPGMHFLSKPYRRRDLARKLREVLDRPLPA